MNDHKSGALRPRKLFGAALSFLAVSSSSPNHFVEGRSLGTQREVTSSSRYGGGNQASSSEQLTSEATGFSAEILELFRQEDPDVLRSPKTWQELLDEEAEAEKMTVNVEVNGDSFEPSESLADMPEIGSFDNLSDMSKYFQDA